MIRAALALVFGLCASVAMAFELPLSPSAVETYDVAEAARSYALPTGPFADGALPTRTIDGAVQRRAWRIADPNPNTLPLMQQIRANLQAEGYDILFDCAASACGGFDFRAGAEVIAAPAMFVDLGDFRFLAAQRDGAALSVLISKSVAALHVQLIEATTGAAPIPTAPIAEALPSWAMTLEVEGHAVIDGLAFETGSAAPLPGADVALRALADWLRADPARRVLIVGHTDASGSLAANMTISQARAEAVAQRLRSEFAVPAAQLQAAGAGYMAPRAPNDDEAGRALNRRVEAVRLPAAG
ncbi:OmpA family protein [Ketogulonicigenium vulgare]|uniref:OmpA family protein n=1 Tax=Ketogulonicigenium vulgare TaxID=92945 RepID=UPI002359AA71|nr:OmpA family protein [Ketogulonicigenium vulgare]